MTHTTLVPDAAAIDLSDPSFWRRSGAERDAALGVMRRDHPVSWQRPPDPGQLPPELFWPTGYWAIVRHADVAAVSRDTTTFLSEPGVFFQGTFLTMKQSIMEMDAPRHAAIRRLVSSAFTPRQVARLEAGIRERAREIVGALDSRAEFDFIEHVATPMPTVTISDMMGVPPSDHERVTGIVNALVSWNDHDSDHNDPLGVLNDNINALVDVAIDLAHFRLRHPGNDLMTAIVHAEIDGQKLSYEDIGAFFMLLSVAGLETTRRTTGQAALALTENPGEREYLLADLDGRIAPAVEEFIRWASPVWAFCRTAARDTQVAGQPIAAGDRVALFYRSANFDETVFADPGRFRVGRSPNPHVSFGGGGPHHCLGAALARAQLRALMGELLTRAPRFTVGEADVLVNSFAVPHDHRGRRLKRLPCRLSGD
jgi:cytochrome P450